MITEDQPPERINWQDLPPNDGQGDEFFPRSHEGSRIFFAGGYELRPSDPEIRFEYPLAGSESYGLAPGLGATIERFSRWLAEHLAEQERVERRSAEVVRCSTTHTMVVMHDGDVVYNKHPDKIVPPAIFG